MLVFHREIFYTHTKSDETLPCDFIEKTPGILELAWGFAFLWVILPYFISANCSASHTMTLRTLSQTFRRLAGVQVQVFDFVRQLRQKLMFDSAY
jgi:hypothetical protein